jgi:2,3-dihydroxyphenylpropionate 1,2-dioxygenase
MPVQLICCSHSPLMTTGIEETEQGVQGQFFRELDSCAAALHKFNPDLVVVFGPDHFNGFFYELMPAFCIGTAAQATKAWHLEGGALRVPRELAVNCVRHLQSCDFDVALSHAMKVDHGITIPLFKLTGALDRYDVLPVPIPAPRSAGRGRSVRRSANSWSGRT